MEISFSGVAIIGTIRNWAIHKKLSCKLALRVRIVYTLRGLGLRVDTQNPMCWALGKLFLRTAEQG